MSQFVKEVKVPLTEEQTQEYSVQLAQEVINLEQLKEEKREAMKEHSDKIKELQTWINETAEKIASGHELVPMDCEFCKDYAAGMVDIVVVDTGALVESRAMTTEEKQMGLEDAA